MKPETPISLISFRVDPTSQIIVFCQTCIDQYGINPVLYQSAANNWVTRHTAQSIRDHKQGHGPSLDHQVYIFDSNFRLMF